MNIDALPIYGIPPRATLFERNGRGAIYAIGKNEFEVVQFLRCKPRKYRGIAYPERLEYPGASKWGIYGWTCTPNSHRDPIAAGRARLALVVSGTQQNLTDSDKSAVSAIMTLGE